MLSDMSPTWFSKHNDTTDSGNSPFQIQSNSIANAQAQEELEDTKRFGLNYEGYNYVARNTNSKPIFEDTVKAANDFETEFGPVLDINGMSLRNRER